MPGYFKISLHDQITAAWGSVVKTLKVESINQYKGNLRVDFSVSGFDGVVNPPYGYVFLDEDEVVNCAITVSGPANSSGFLTAEAYDGEDTDTDDIAVNIT